MTLQHMCTGVSSALEAKVVTVLVHINRGFGSQLAHWDPFVALHQTFLAKGKAECRDRLASHKPQPAVMQVVRWRGTCCKLAH